MIANSRTTLVLLALTKGSQEQQMFGELEAHKINHKSDLEYIMSHIN